MAQKRAGGESVVAERDIRGGMECPRCGSPSWVARTENYASVIRRLRVCRRDVCRHTWFTVEVIERRPERKDGHGDGLD